MTWWEWHDPAFVLAAPTLVFTAYLRQRRGTLLLGLGDINDPTHLELLWEEWREYDGHGARVLRRAVRANPHVHLPGSPMSGVWVNEGLDDGHAVADYVAGLERRYGEASPGWHFWGLTDFVRHIQALGV